MAELGWDEVASIAAGLAGELQKQRWFGAKAKSVRSCELRDYGIAQHSGVSYLLPIITVNYEEGGSDDYFIPLAGGPREGERKGIGIDAGDEHFSDALFDRGFMSLVFSMLASGSSVTMQKGAIKAEPAPGVDSLEQPSATRVVSSEQSNTSVIVDGGSIYKSYRRLERGNNPDYEVPLRLAYSSNFSYVPKPLGKLVYSDDQTSTVGSLSKFVPNEGDCWTFFLKSLSGYLGQKGGPSSEELSCIGWVKKMGSMTAGLHNSLSALMGEESFAPVPVSATDIENWMEDYRRLITDVFGTLKRSLGKLSGKASATASEVLEAEKTILDSGSIVRTVAGTGMHKIRIHGDYHLGQILKAGAELYIIDFEGEPMRTLEYRRSPHSALRDVSGMLRSLDYALNYTTRELGEGGYSTELADSWTVRSRDSFLESYWSSYSPGAAYLPPTFQAMLDTLRFFEMEKAVYELNYELNNRPDWAAIPLGAIARLSGIAAQTLNKDPG